MSYPYLPIIAGGSPSPEAVAPYLKELSARFVSLFEAAALDTAPTEDQWKEGTFFNINKIAARLTAIELLIVLTISSPENRMGLGRCAGPTVDADGFDADLRSAGIERPEHCAFIKSVSPAAVATLKGLVDPDTADMEQAASRLLEVRGILIRRERGEKVSEHAVAGVVGGLLKFAKDNKVDPNEMFGLNKSGVPLAPDSPDAN